MSYELALPAGNHDIVVLDSHGLPSLRHDGCSPQVMRARIDALTAFMLDLPSDDQRELKVEHVFLDGMYLRKLHIPAGTLLVGRVHRRSCFNIVSEGELDVLTEFGSRRLYAGFIGVSGEGIQKVGLAHKDTVFINVFRTDETDVDKVEDIIAAPAHVPMPGDLQLELI